MVRFIGSLIPALCLLGCLGPDGDGATNNLIETCDGEYECSAGADSYSYVLARNADDECLLDGALALYADGSTTWSDTGESDGLTWTGTAAAFDLCGAAACLHCSRTSPPVAPSSSGGRCTGSAPSCYGRGAGSCSTVDGCHLQSHVTWDGDIEYECGGSSTSCSSYYSAGGCTGQSGCHWVD